MFFRIFWSIYFALSIALIGSTGGYLISGSLLFVAHLMSPISALSTPIRLYGELILCYVIRFLLWTQPWLICSTNFPSQLSLFELSRKRKIVYVANHRSNMDTFLLLSYIPGVRGLAKQTLYHNLFFAPFMWIMGFVPVEKGSPQSFIQGLKLVHQRLLDQKRPFLVFPENQRCQKGFVGLQKFSVAPFVLAVEAKALVVPVVMKATDALMGRGDLWLHPFRPIEIQMLDPIESTEFEDGVALAKAVTERIGWALS